MKRNDRAVKIAEDVYWAGSAEKQRGLGSNPYLIMTGDSAVLLDPGSALDFEVVLGKVTSLVPLSSITAIIAHHQDPDLCAAIPLFEQAGFRGTIVTHWRTSLIIQHYKTESPFYLVDENSYEYELVDGKRLHFIPAPYLHFAGAIMTWDAERKILFSGDLFGSIGDDDELFADPERYIPAMKTFHEHYMPSNQVLRSAMDRISDLDISMIAPQHGSIITGNCGRYIEVLKKLDCGLLLKQKRSPAAASSSFIDIMNQVLSRLAALYSRIDWKMVLSELPCTFSPDGRGITACGGSEQQIWDKLFETVVTEQGAESISALEPLARRTVLQSDLDYPAVYHSRFLEAELEKESITEENLRLRKLLAKNEIQHQNAEEMLMSDPLTALHNERYFRFFVQDDFSDAEDRPASSAFLFIGLDHLPRINLDFGKDEGDRSLATLAYLLENFRKRHALGETHHLFKMAGPVFIYYLTDTEREDALLIAEEIRREVEAGDLFITPATVSIGLVFASELGSVGRNPEDIIRRLEAEGQSRLTGARKAGMNTIFLPEENTIQEGGRKLVLILDQDSYYVRLLADELNRKGYATGSCDNGEIAIKTIEERIPDAIISEVSIPMFGGIEIRSRLLGNPRLKQIPFILVSYAKNDSLIRQAYKAGIFHFFRKPVSLVEIGELLDLELGQQG
jgi:diguanylate cyclase (GGDEF)-like protein